MIKKNKNYTNFPTHYFTPDEITVGNRKFVRYFVRFDTLNQIYDVIKKGNPEINRKIFTTLSSETGSYSFAGIPYAEAVEDMINLNEEGYGEFIRLIREVANIKQGDKHEYETIKTLAGGHLNIVDYARSVPQCYESYQRVKRPKFLTIDSTLSYSWTTSKEQVLNRAIILVSIVNALEKNGYNVNLNSFELSKEGDELIHIVVGVKRQGQMINLQTLYKTSCHVEFLRRILFRILETLPVQRDWHDGYGSTCEQEFVDKALNIGKDDIYFGTPQELGIRGNDLAQDFKSALARMHLDDKFDIRGITEEFEAKTKRLIK